MSIISWNCRDLSNLRVVHILKDLIRTHKVDVVFLYETLVHANKIEEVRRRIGFDYCLRLIGRDVGEV